MWSETANFAVESGADLVVAGSGGDDIVDYDQLLIDRLATGSVTGRFRDAKVAASASPGRFARALTQGVKDAIPSGAKTLIRTTLYRRGESADTLIRQELWDAIESQPPVMALFDFDFPMLTQTAPVAAAVHPSVAWVNELQEAQYASTGIDLSHPYFDRQLIEFVASLPPRAHPFEGSTKPLTRRAFADHLPESVLTRHTKTVADDYLDHIFVLHARQYRERYPNLSPLAQAFFDNGRYLTLLSRADSGRLDFTTRESLWSAWTVMAWLDGFDRYKEKQVLPELFGSIEHDEEAI